MMTSDTFERGGIYPDFAKINTPLDDKEYKALLNKLKNSPRNADNQSAYFSKFDSITKTYQSIDLNEEGLVPYCGYDDCSNMINTYLSGRLTKKTIDEKYWFYLPKNTDTLPDMVRVMEYSLNYIDNKYGKYEGIVYRAGSMSENPSQYISTSMSPDFPAIIDSDRYAVVKVDNGHKIVDFQQEVNSEYADREKEILLPLQNNYTKLSNDELTQDLIDAREQFASKLQEGEKKHLTKEEILNKIDVYVQNN